MKAEEARKITAENLKGSVIEPLLKIAYSRIKEFAEKGKSSVPHPFYGLDLFPTEAATESAIQHLRNEGYTAKYNHVPPSADPREHSYWEISW